MGHREEALKGKEGKRTRGRKRRRQTHTDTHPGDGVAARGLAVAVGHAAPLRTGAREVRLRIDKCHGPGAVVGAGSKVYHALERNTRSGLHGRRDGIGRSGRDTVAEDKVAVEAWSG